MSKRFLSAEEILATDDRKIEELEVPEWGCFIHVRPLSADERDEYEQGILDGSTAKKTNIVGARGRLALLGACKADGSPLFTAAQLEALRKKNAGAVDRIASRVSVISGLTKEAVEEAKGN